MPKSRDRWQPSSGDLLGIAGFALAVVVYLTQPNWAIGGLLAILAIALVVFAAFRHSSHPLLRMLIGGVVVAGFIAVIWRPLWNSFHKDYPRVAFSWPISLSGPALPPDPPDLPPLDLPGPPLSKWGKVMYLCPLPTNIDPKDSETVKGEIRKNAEIFGKAAGISLVFSDIAYGVRFDLTANDAEGQMHMQGIQRFTLQMERMSRGIFVTAIMDWQGGMGILGNIPVERGSDPEKSWNQLIESVLGFPKGKCRLI